MTRSCWLHILEVKTEDLIEAMIRVTADVFGNYVALTGVIIRHPALSGANQRGFSFHGLFRLRNSFLGTSGREEDVPRSEKR
jgi:hypothetical protein